jgi:hypothetical protein
VTAQRRFRFRARQAALKLIVVGALTCVMALGVRAITREEVFRVSVAPGTVTWVDVEVPMQRAGRPKSFVKEFGLPVRCSISAADDDGDVRLVVVETGHKVHRMWAKLRVEASSWASPGARTRFVEFTINGEGGWPTAKVVITVEG